MSRKKYLFIFSALLLIFLLSTLFLFTKKHHDYQLETIVNETPSYVEAITSIITSEDSINNVLDTHIKAQQKFFYEQIQSTFHTYLIDRDELNIDCQFQRLDRNIWYISLITSMKGPSFSSPYYRIDCWTWDIKKQQVLNLENIFSPSTEFSAFQDRVFQELQKECPSCLSEENFTKILGPDFHTFQVTETGITLYFNPFLFQDDYFDIIPISIEMDTLSIKQEKQEEKKKFSNQKKVSPSRIIDPSKPVVALTFDDGPSQYTEEIIQILKENEVNATFFILGNKVERYQDILRKSVQNGNELGNHSYNHQWLSHLSTDELMTQIRKTQSVIQEKIQYTPRYLRPTYGSVTNRIRKNANLEIALWTVDTKDWRIHNVNRIVERATKKIKDGDIILMHDIFERSKDALKEIIPILKKQGFQFVTISELEEVKKIRKFENLYPKKET